MLTLILGGARSGKSRLAERLVSRVDRVCYLATAQPDDDSEMLARIERHRGRRPESWLTIEEPLALADAVERAAPQHDAILVDCLTVWLSNLFLEHRESAPGFVLHLADCELTRMTASASACHIILVSNEVGSGIVPETSIARDFRDVHGLLNQRAAEVADEVILTVAGLPLYLKGI
jgi:adenosylcobinamide kinase/adenosylcobinamide-phosphate guanylyltransferase